jgi:hypothetical protein
MNMSFCKSATILMTVMATISINSAAISQTMPPIKAADLNKKTVSWPGGLPAERTIIMVAFTQGQQKNIDGWVDGMKLKSPNAPIWFEMPLIGKSGSVARFFIDNGMRGGIPNKQDRARVVTVYSDKAAMMKSMGLPSEKQIHVLVVDRSGRILERVSGDYSAAGEAAIRKALKQ